MMSKVCIISSVHNALDNRIFYREAVSLQNAGYKITLIAVHDKLEYRDGIQILPIKRYSRLTRPFLWWQILRLALSTKSDLFHIHDPELLFISPMLRLLSSKPVIYDIHESIADFIEIKDDIPLIIRKFLGWIFRWLEPAMARIASGLIFADDQIAQAFHDIHCPKITLFNYPSDLFLSTANQSIKINNMNKPVLLYLGGLKRNRGTTLMLNAFKLVKEAVPNSQLMLVGPFAPASLEKELRTEINQLKMSDAVTITGTIPFDQVGKYLSIASVGWIPFPTVKKYQKNIPTKLFEYMAYGIPVVSSDLIPVRPFIENRKNGILVKADDPNGHAQAIIEILTNPTLSATMGINGQRMVLEQYRWSEMEKRLLKFYDQLLINQV